MNYISISPDIILYLLQQQNIKYKTPCLIKRFNNETEKDYVENKKVEKKKNVKEKKKNAEEKNTAEKNELVGEKGINTI
jgi:hypothetical protein